MAMKTRRFTAVLAVLAVLSAFTLAFAVPALADPPQDKVKQGKEDKPGKGNDKKDQSDSGYTEDNDTNDGDTPNNVVDEGDNKHPSGKDRSVEHGGSGNQGKSGSDPDGDENGGLDKPNGSGGDDLADQDGNNGCGNDDDFEDDNNGNCGGKDKDKGKDKSKDTDEPSDDVDGDVKDKSKDPKVTICHATGSAKNPFVVITPAASGVYHGHMGHQDGRDIIPTFTYKGGTYSQNWDAAGQALFANGCSPADAPPAGEVCEYDETMPADSPDCKPAEEPEVCVWDETMPADSPDCVKGDDDEVCEYDETMPADSEDCKPAEEPEVCEYDETMPADSTDCHEPDGVLGSGESMDDDDVLGLLLHQDEALASPDVQAAVKAAAARGGALPFTGGEVLPILLAAIGLLLAGFGAVRIAKAHS
jgi:hypothetical protein